VGGFRLNVLCNNISSLSAFSTRGLGGLRFSAPLRCFGLGRFGLGRFGGLRSLGRRLVRRSCICSGCRCHYGGVRRGFVVAVVVIRGASIFKGNLSYISGAWIADGSSVAFVIVALRKPALVLAAFLMHVPQAARFCCKAVPL
jgi:hypothetical protein